MEPSTIAKIIDNGSQAAAELVKDFVVNRQKRQQLETRKQYEKEIAHARASARSGGTSAAGGGGGAQTQIQRAPQQTPSPNSQEPPEPEATPSDVDALIQGEDCGMCTQILEYIKTLSPDKRAQGIADYGRLKNAMESGGDRESVEKVIDNSDILSEAVSNIA